MPLYIVKKYGDYSLKRAIDKPDNSIGHIIFRANLVESKEPLKKFSYCDYLNADMTFGVDDDETDYSELVANIYLDDGREIELFDEYTNEKKPKSYIIENNVKTYINAYLYGLNDFVETDNMLYEFFEAIKV